MASSSGGSMDWIGGIVQGVGSVWSSSTNAKASHDALNKQSEINDRNFAYQMALSQQGVGAFRNQVVIVAVAIALLMAVFFMFPRRS